MGGVPIDSEIPPEMDDFPFEVQQAFDLYYRLPDRWDGMSGTYLGKDYSALQVMFEMFSIDDRRTALDFITIIDSARQGILARKREAKEKAKIDGPTI